VPLRTVATFTLVVLFAVVPMTSCGGSATPPPPLPVSTITSVTVSPASANLFVKATQQFAASIQGTGSFNPTVTWYVNNVQGGNATVGTITASGLYTAPSAVPNSANVTIKAESVQDPTKTGPVSVTINPEKVQISISPSSPSVQLGTPLQFSATVTGTANTAVFWSVNNFAGGQSGVGLIDQNGLYTAPANLPANTIKVSATSQEDTTKTAATIVTILATGGGITVTVSPQNPSVVFDGSQSIQFTATVTGSSDTSVNWSVDPNFAAIGQISSSGLFTPSAFNCANVPGSGAIRAVSIANAGAQGVSTVNLVPPTPSITALSPQPADAQAILQVWGNFAQGATFTGLYSGPNGTTIPGAITTTLQNAISGPVPLGASSGSFSVKQSCVSVETGLRYPDQQSNALPFQRLPRLRVRANRQILSTGESTQMYAAFMGDQTPRAITWTALSGTVTASGVFTAGASNWDKVTGCITATQQCDFFVFSIVPARTEPAVPVVSTGGTLQLSQIPNGVAPDWTIEAGGGILSSTGLYTAPTTLQDSGAILFTTGSTTNSISVVGNFPGMVNRIIDYPDISLNATGQTTLPRTIAVDGNRAYVLSDNLPAISAGGHYRWIDAYDASDLAHPLWTGAVEGFDSDFGGGFIEPMELFASGGFLWHVTAPSINGNPTALPEVAFFDASSGQPALKQFYTTPELCADTFYQGLYAGIPCSFTPTGQSLWQSPLTVLIFDGRSGTLVPFQVALMLPNPETPASIIAMAITTSRIFLFFSQQRTDGSQAYFLSTYDFTASPPVLLQTISAQPAPLNVPGQRVAEIYGNMLFAGAGIYDISGGLPVLLGQIQTLLPSDMSGSLALVGPYPDDKYRLVDFTSPANPKQLGTLFNGDSFQGPGRFVGNHPYIAGSGVQVFDVSAPTGGPIPGAILYGAGSISFAAIDDLLVNSSVLYAAENTDLGNFVTSFDLGSTPAKKIGSFVLADSEIPLAFASTGNFLFVGTSNDLLVFDVTNPSSPVIAASLPQPASALALVGSLLYAGTPDNHLVVINVINPGSPVIGSSQSLVGYPVTMQAKGNLLFIAADTAGLLTYSIANPVAPVLLSQFQPSSAVDGVAVDGTLALLAASDGGFVITNIANPVTPVLEGQFSMDQLSCFADLSFGGTPALLSISLDGGIAYLGSVNMSGSVFGFDYRQPRYPRLVSATHYGVGVNEAVLALAFSGANTFVAGVMSVDGSNLDDSVFIADVTQPRNFMRQMCLPPPFVANTGTIVSQAKKNSSGPSAWNFKAKGRTRPH
jgi:hypothetical protein